MQFSADFKESDKKFPVRFNNSENNFGVVFKNIQIATVRPDVEIYEGEYTVTPKVEAQTVPTAQKYMTEDMKVKAIPFYDVSNAFGGNTIYIGNEV